MAVSRPFLLVALGALLVVATFASVRSAADRAQADDTPAAAPAVVRPAPGTTPAAKPKPTPPEAKAKPKQPPVQGIPANVAKALAARRTVVVFFRQPAADDDATASAVHSLRGMKNVSVFSAPITKLSRYRRVVASLGVTQAPAVVIVGKDRKARLVEGFVDGGTLRQQVRDSR